MIEQSDQACDFDTALECTRAPRSSRHRPARLVTRTFDMKYEVQLIVIEELDVIVSAVFLGLAFFAASIPSTGCFTPLVRPDLQLATVACLKGELLGRGGWIFRIEPPGA